MSIRQRSLQIISTLCTLGLAISVLLWTYLIVLPSPIMVAAEQSGGSVYFSVNRGIILFPNDCVTLRWQVDNIRSVYLNDQPQVGGGESRLCITGEMPRLTVQFRDGSQQTYVIHITTLSLSPLSWLIVMLALAVIALRYHPLKRLWQRPQHLALVLGLLALIFGLFWGQMIPLSESVAISPWVEASEATKSILTGMTSITVLILMASTIVQNALETPADISPPTPSHRALMTWGMGLALTVGIVSGIILAVNPLGMYFASPYPSHQLLLRGSKTESYQQLAQTPDVVIMGSSRAFTLSPRYIEQQTGYSAYNMAIEGGRIEDVLIQARQMRAFPKVMMIEVQDGLPRQPNDIAARAPLTWLPYMRFETTLLTLQKRLEGLVDVNQLAGAIYTARYARLYDRQPKEWPAFAPDGLALRQPITASALEQALLLDIGNIPALTCGGLDEISQDETATLIEMANARHTAIVFYMSPWHPRYYNSLLKNNAAYQECHARTVAYMSALGQQHNAVFFLDYSQLERINGTADETGFFDSQHLTEANSQRLIDHALATLTAAYHSARQERGEE